MIDERSVLLVSPNFDFTSTFGLNPTLSYLLGLRFLESYCKALPFSNGFADCVDFVVKERGFDVDKIKKAACIIPLSGPILITSNHPTGILDGAVLLCALLSRRADVLIVANDLLVDLPMLGNYIIPIKKTKFGDRNGTNMLIQVRRAWKRNACIVVFPSGTVEHWHWNKFKICDAPWTTTFQNFANILKVTEFQARLTMQNPVLFHIFAAFSKRARLIFLIHAFNFYKNSNNLSPISFSEVKKKSS